MRRIRVLRHVDCVLVAAEVRGVVFRDHRPERVPQSGRGRIQACGRDGLVAGGRVVVRVGRLVAEHEELRGAADLGRIHVGVEPVRRGSAVRAGGIGIDDREVHHHASGRDVERERQVRLVGRDGAVVAAGLGRGCLCQTRDVGSGYAADGREARVGHEVLDQVAHVGDVGLLVLDVGKLAGRTPGRIEGRDEAVTGHAGAALRLMVTRDRDHVGAHFHQVRDHAAPIRVLGQVLHDVGTGDLRQRRRRGRRPGTGNRRSAVTVNHVAVEEEQIRFLGLDRALDTRPGLRVLQPD